jgi:hypothetical protein
MQALQTHRHDPFLSNSRMEQRRIMIQSKEGGLPQITFDSFIPFRFVPTTGQRPLSPESDHNLTHQGGYR